MTASQPVALQGTEIALPWGGNRIRRILERPVTGDRVAAIVDLCPGRDNPPWLAAYVDATAATPPFVGSGTTVVHVLWAAGGAARYLAAGIEPGEPDFALRAFEAHPGDTLTVPPGVPFAIGTGILGFVLANGPVNEWDGEAFAAGASIRPPTHGLQVFTGFNRRTVCAATPDLVLERWKLTQPLTLSPNPDRWHYLTNLVAPVALGWPGGADILARTGSRLLPRGMASVTLVPGGLGYVLLGYAPDLERDVLLPLRSAGYDQAAIDGVVAADDPA